MRKIVTWLLVALFALQCVAFAETAPVAVTAVNGGDAVRTASDLYFASPSEGRQMLVRVSLTGGEPVCVDRADSFSGLMPYENGAAYLKTTGGASAIARVSGNEVSTIYAFGAASASRLSFYGGKFLVLMDGLLHSVEPATQLCLKLSGAKMLDYVLGAGNAYFLSDGDRMEYTAQLEDNQSVSTQAGCIYSLDLNSGETTLLLKSGASDLKILGDQLYFHNLADAYAVRAADETRLLGRVYSLNVQRKDLKGECTEPDSGFWPTDKGLVAWYGGALNLGGEAGNLALCNPENGATVVSDGNFFYVWEAGKQTLSQVSSVGTQQTIYTGDLAQAQDAALAVASASVEPSASAPAPTSDTATDGNTAWFDQFMENKDIVSNGGSTPRATPIGATPTPRPTATPVPNQSAGTTTGGGTSSGGGSSSGTSSSGSYKVNVSYVKITGNSVNIRSKAGTSGKILGSVSKGAIIECAGVAAKDSKGTVWYKVEHNGKTGWVTSKYAKKSGAPDPSYVGPEVSAKGDAVKVVGGSVTLRKKANKTSDSLGAIPEGTVVTFLNKASTDARGVKWYKVEYDGTTGWISSRYAKITTDGSSSSSYKYVKATGGSVTIRSSADKESSALGAIEEGNTGSYLGASATDSRGVKWYKVKYNGVTGWVSSRYAQLTNTASSGGSSSSAKTEVEAVGGSVTIRAKANKSSEKLGFMADGSVGKYLGKSSTDSRGVKWYKVSYDGVTGWVSSKFSRLK